MRQDLATLMAAAFLAIASATAAAAPATECLQPGPAPFLPDGSFATRDQIERARTSVFRFTTALRDYRTCLQQKLDTAPPEIGPAEKQNWRANIIASLTRERALQQDFDDQSTKFLSK
jgi:hypothetical protein